MKKLKLSVQEHLLPGDDLVAKFNTATELGFDALELRAKDDFKNRKDELTKAVKAGVIISSVCPDTTTFFTDFDEAKRKQAIENVKSWLSTIAEVTGQNIGVITPASWGLFTRALPPHIPPRSEEEDSQVILSGLKEIAAHGEKVGATLLIEPLNRYEDYMINTIEQAAGWCEQVNSPALGVMADTYHMNIAERSMTEPLVTYKKWIQHVHLSDSNRAEPGMGHIDYEEILRTLDEIGFGGYMAVECKLTGEPADALRESASFIRSIWDKIA